MTETIVVATIIGSVILFKEDFFGGFVELIYEVFSNESFQFIVLLLMGIGGMIKLFERSGALAGFRQLLRRFVKGPKSAMVVTWLLAVIMFIDDYLCLLTVSSSMKGLTDRYRVPREHLAYTLNAQSISLCLLIPFSSWSVFTITNIKQFDLTRTDYLKAIIYMFYPIASIVIALLLALGILPKVFNMKKAYERVDQGGPTLPEISDQGASIVEDDDTAEKVVPSTPLNFFIPMIVLIVVMMLSNRNIIHGILAALFCILVLYKGQKIMTVGQFFNNFFDGMKAMVAIAFVVLFAFIIAVENEKLGFAPYVIGIFSKFITPALLPLFIFLIMSVVSFTMGDVWSLILISLPIFIPMAVQMNVKPVIALAALLSGANLGILNCLQSDALFMTYAGSGVPNVTQIKTGLPYMALAAFLAAVGYLIIGLIG